MGFIITLFKSIWNSISKVLGWLIGLPGLILSSAAGAYTAIHSLIASFSTGDDLASHLTEVVTTPVEALVGVVNGLPDIVKLGFYALSLDVGWNTFLSFWGLVFPLAIALLTFMFVSVILYVVGFYSIKLTAFGLASILPSGWCPHGLKVFAGLPISRAFHPPFNNTMDLTEV